MSRVATRSPDDNEDNAKAVLKAASDVIESEQANVRIEIEFSKAARVGLMLKEWRKIMTTGDGRFTDEWVDYAAMDIFHQFFSSPFNTIIQEEYFDNDDH